MVDLRCDMSRGLNFSVPVRPSRNGQLDRAYDPYYWNSSLEDLDKILDGEALSFEELQLLTIICTLLGDRSYTFSYNISYSS